MSLKVYYKNKNKNEIIITNQLKKKKGYKKFLLESFHMDEHVHKLTFNSVTPPLSASDLLHVKNFIAASEFNIIQFVNMNQNVKELSNFIQRINITTAIVNTIVIILKDCLEELSHFLYGFRSATHFKYLILLLPNKQENKSITTMYKNININVENLHIRRSSFFSLFARASFASNILYIVTKL
eukprot:snap_masked-scaffold_54-processed-gene-1.56-mRNA-1 protein AED:1.00 eAED:1.00 QI:0/-1/0/0/-1/1/1/0/183